VNGLDEIIDEISRCRRFLVASHINPEGDCIGSLLAFGKLLRYLGKDFVLYNADEIPDQYSFLPGSGDIVHTIPEGFSPDVIFTVDTPSIERADPNGRFNHIGAKIVNIDHHPSNRLYGDYNYVDENAASTGVIIYRLFKRLEIPLDGETATDIFCSIMVDTGRFRFSNANSEAFSICAEMVDAGADPDYITTKVYYQLSFQSLKALGRLLSDMELHLGGKVASISVTDDLLSEGESTLQDIEGLADYTISVRGVKVGILFRESPGDVVRVSFRSTGDVDVNLLAAEFGGGGHRKAAGCKINGTLQDVRSKVIEETSRWI